MLEEFERAYIGGVLEASGGKLTAAARYADMDPKNFSEKLVRYGLRKSGGVEGARTAFRTRSDTRRWLRGTGRRGSTP